MTFHQYISGYAIVEGQTESAFFDRVLNPYLSNIGIHISPIVVETSEGHKGGAINLDRLRNDYNKISRHGNAMIIIVCLDFHRLPNNFPNYQRTNNPIRDAEVIEIGLREYLGGDRRLFPYIELHDFEALLFSEPQAFERSGVCDSRQVNQLLAVRENYDSPEHINHGCPPAHHIKRIIPKYKKLVGGPIIAQEIGIEKIKLECAHFSAWLDSLVAFAETLR